MDESNIVQADEEFNIKEPTISKFQLKNNQQKSLVVN
jgi:hypothetical protein